MVGKVVFEPTHVQSVAAGVSGRIDRLWLSEPGFAVASREPLAKLFCPDLLEDQRALIEAVAAQREAGSQGGGFFNRLKGRNVETARAALRLRGLHDEQIEDIAKLSKPSEHITLYAPMAGRLVAAQAREGDYVAAHEELFLVADLSTVCLVLQAREADLPWLRYGQQVRFVADVYPDMPMGGWVSAIAATVDAESGIVEVRVLVPNEHRMLRPGMGVQAELSCLAMGHGVVYDPNLADRWLCPVHPAVVADGPETCRLCQRTLVSAQTLGYVQVTPDTEKPLLVPTSALYVTEPETRVICRRGNAPREKWQTQAIEVGAYLGSWCDVRHGLAEGDRVVVDAGKFNVITNGTE
jgi:Cu(I)/Ag(I) efflux system membrane fusion protein